MDAAGITIFGIIARVPLVPEQAHIPIWVKQVQSSLFHYCFTPFPRDHIAILIEHPTALLSFIILILIIRTIAIPFLDMVLAGNVFLCMKVVAFRFRLSLVVSSAPVRSNFWTFDSLLFRS